MQSVFCASREKKWDDTSLVRVCNIDCCRLFLSSCYTSILRDTLSILLNSEGTFLKSFTECLLKHIKLASNFSRKFLLGCSCFTLNWIKSHSLKRSIILHIILNIPLISVWFSNLTG